MRVCVLAFVIGATTFVSSRPVEARQEGQPPATGGNAVVDAMTLRAEGKAEDAVALLKRFLARHPDDAAAHFELGLTYSHLAKTAAGAKPSSTPAQQRPVQQALAHLDRAVALTGDPEMRYMALRHLAHLHASDVLNRPMDAERYARRMIREDAARIDGYAMLSQILEAQGRYDAAADALRAARRSVPDMPAMFQLRLAQFLVQQVTETPGLPAAAAGRLLEEARGVLDELIRQKQEVRLALMAKSMAVKVQAERVETRADRRKALLAESEVLYERARIVSHDGSPLARTVADEWQDAQSKALSGGDGSPEDGRVYEQFVARHPDFAPARIALGRWTLSRAQAIADRTPTAAATRTKLLEAAVNELRRGADIATDPSDRTLALAHLIDALGPNGLDRPEAASTARAAVAKHPNDSLLVMRLLQTLLPSAGAATDAALREVRAATPPPEAQIMLGMYLWELASSKKRPVAPAVARRLLSEAIVAFDAALSLKADDVQALTYKNIVLRQLAELESDPARARELLTEADQLRDRVKQLMAREKKTPGA